MDIYYPKNEPIPKIVLAARAGDLKAIQKYIANGMDLNQQQKWIEIEPKYGYTKEWQWSDNTALIEASQGGYIDIVRELLLAGCDPTIRAYPKCMEEYHDAIEAATNSTKRNNKNAEIFNTIIEMLRALQDLWNKHNKNKHHKEIPISRNIKREIQKVLNKHHDNNNYQYKNDTNRNNKRKLIDITDDVLSEPDKKRRKLSNTNIFIRDTNILWKTGDIKRDKMISKFFEILKPTQDKIEYVNYMELAVDIEQNLVYKFGVGSRDLVAKYRDLHYNIKKNDDLKMKLLFGMIEAAELVSMTNAEMATKSQIEQRNKYRKQTINNSRNDHGMESLHAITDEFKCDKCNKSKCKYTQAQIGAVYQAMTTFVTCLECGNKWKC